MKAGKMHWLTRDLTGQTFGVLRVLSWEGSNGHHNLWRFQCQCGKKVVKPGVDVTAEVTRGGTPNCGCLTRALISKGNQSHGMSKHPAYAVYRSMIDRCKLPTHLSWKNYGGRGITVCKRWQDSFENFWADMGGSYQRGLDLDREDNELGYCKSNCRWTTRRANTMNKRNTIHMVDVGELSRQTGIGVSTIYNRIRVGWPVAELGRAPDFRNRCTTSSTAGRATVSSSAEKKRRS